MTEHKRGEPFLGRISSRCARHIKATERLVYAGEYRGTVGKEMFVSELDAPGVAVGWKCHIPREILMVVSQDEATP